MFIILGALIRRYWGGWLRPVDAVKKIFIIPAITVIAYTTMRDIDLALFAGVIIGCSIWFINSLFFFMPESFKFVFRHAWAQEMGFNPEHPLWKCIIVYWVIYWIPMIMVGCAWFLSMHSKAGLIYSLLGVLTPLPHYMAQLFKAKWMFKDPTKGYFIDGPTCFGELGLGAILIGGFSIAASIASIL